MLLQRKEGPSALILSRQPLKVYEKAHANWEHALISYGAYVVSDSVAEPQTVIVATGSEVNLAIETKRLLNSDRVRVVSMMCRELFLKAPVKVREMMIPSQAKKLVIEAGVSQGWEAIAGDNGQIRCIEDFGKSASLTELVEFYGFTAFCMSNSLKTD
jgi:transketolase